MEYTAHLATIQCSHCAGYSVLFLCVLSLSSCLDYVCYSASVGSQCMYLLVLTQKPQRCTWCCGGPAGEQSAADASTSEAGSSEGVLSEEDLSYLIRWELALRSFESTS
jgi:hypothetical protein